MQTADFNMNTKSRFFRSGFTLIELLTVIAIIGILAGIIIPTVSGVRNSAKKASTRAQFNQMISSMTLFKQEYGYYPKFGTTDGKKIFSNAADTQLMAGTLSGRKVDGSTADAGDLGGNRKRLAFYSFGDKDISAAGILQDAFENVEIGVAVDVAGTGFITQGAGAVRSVTTDRTFTPSTGSATTDIPTGGVRAGVIIYSAGNGNGSGSSVTSSNAVMSWK